MHVVSHPVFASGLLSHALCDSQPCSHTRPFGNGGYLNGPKLAGPDGLGVRSVNEGCSSLAVLSGTSPSNLATLFAVTPELIGM